jgi:microcystin-dependent protein
MKNICRLIAVIVTFGIYIPLTLSAQAPDKMSYQAVVRDASEDLVVNATVGIQISILQGTSTGTPVYVETHTPSTNINGLVTLEIGAGTTGDDFSSIDWANGPYFIKTETDPAGGTNYSISGTSQLLSVPYALYAETAALATGETDPVFDASVAGNITAEDTARWGSSPLPIAQSGNIITYDGNNWIAKDLVVSTGVTGNGVAINNMQPYLALNYCIALQGIFPSRNSDLPFIGEIELYGFNFTPRGFASCSGQLLAIAQNTALFSLLGTIYGGDGRTTFGLPDLRGRVPISFGQGPGLSNRPIGQKSGTETVILNIANLPPHNHPINISFED